MKHLYRKFLRLGALRFCKLYAIEQRHAGAEAAKDSEEIKALGHYQNAVAAETIIREICIERTNELYNKYNTKPTSNHANKARRHTAEH